MWWKFQNINRKDFGTLHLLSALESRFGGGWAASELLPDPATDLEDGPIKLSSGLTWDCWALVWLNHGERGQPREESKALGVMKSGREPMYLFPQHCKFLP